MKIPYSVLVSCIVLILSLQAKAGLQIPYTPDANTTHLWHFDNTFTNLDGTTNILTADEVTSGGITLTNVTQTQVPGSTITLGNLSYSGMSNCLHVIPTNLLTGNTYAFASGGPVADSTVINGSSGGAFTFEAIIKMDANPFLTTGSSENWEIICGDNSNNGSQVRGWQFRISTGASASINFNAAPGYIAGTNNINAPLPNSGPNAVAAGQWYHVAVTYTGSSPTNGDTANVLTLYWTLLDANRTYADILLQTNVQSGFGIPPSVTASLGVGGNGRANSGVANGEGFKGYIDEARMSIVALQSNQMAFTTGGSVTPPSFLSQPPTNTFLGYGQTLTLPTLVSGTQPIGFQWYLNGVSLAGQTNNTLVTNVTFALAGNYQIIATNLYGSATSTVAQVSVGAGFSELFNTGVNNDGTLPTGGTGVYDSHYTLIQSSSITNPGPNVTIWNMATAPLKANGGRFQNADSLSQWVGPTIPAAEPSGIYTYRTRFLIDQADVNTAKLQGTFWVNVADVDVVLNGISQGKISADLNDHPGTINFTITNGLVAGLNTLDFVTTNSASGLDTESALRVELSGIGQALPAGKPVITVQPANQTVEDANAGSGNVSTATFSTVALGRPPLSYQWYADNNPVADATNRTLAFANPSSSASLGTNFKVVVSNASGSVTSSVAVLTLVSTNQPAIAPTYTLSIYSNTSATFNLDTAFLAATDADGDSLSLGNPAFDSTTTNGVTLVQNGAILTYTPPADYVGADQFNYYITDSQGATTAGAVNINVLPLAANGISATATGNNIVVTGAGSPLGTFHVLSSTNLTIPLSNWVVTATGTFDNAGNASITNSTASTNGPQKFYILQVP